MCRINFYILLFLFFTKISIGDEVKIQSTTSTRDSGLYSFLLPMYPEFNLTKIKVIAVGTGQAILNAKNCDGDILIVHDKDRELSFMADGFGSKRHELMYNDYVIIGPSSDPANIINSKTANQAFFKIYNSRSKFISRSDSSGTYTFERSIWNKVGIKPRKFSGKWYLESGQGMGPSLNIAVAINAYTLSDRSSWLKFNNKRSHTILYENQAELRNEYGMILINKEKCPNTNSEAATKLFNWLASPEAQKLIEAYKINQSQVFYIY